MGMYLEVVTSLNSKTVARVAESLGLPMPRVEDNIAVLDMKALSEYIKYYENLVDSGPDRIIGLHDYHVLRLLITAMDNDKLVEGTEQLVFA